MKKVMLLALTIVALTSCQKEENYKYCGLSPIDGQKKFAKKGKCYEDVGVFTFNRFQRVDKKHCPCL